MNWIHANGITLHYAQTGLGDGPTLVFINSLGSDFRIWDGALAQLPSRKVLRYDKRGHGLSALAGDSCSIGDHANDLCALLDALRLEDVVLIGISVGGLIALQTALQRRVAGLVLCDTGAKIGSTESWQDRIAAVRASGMASIADAVLARWFTPNFRTTHAAQFDGYAAMLRQQHPHGYIATCAALRDADLRPHLPQITAPTLVVCGTADSSTPPALSEALRDGIAGARLTWIEGAAHLPCIEKPAEVAAAIAGFVDTLAHAAYDTHTRGMAVRRAVLGDAHVDKAEANKTEFDADFQRFITEMAWGSVWARPGLGRHTRHLLTIAMLAALGKEHELAMHIRATQNTGVTQSEVKEVLLQVAVYAGLPAANRAIAIAKKIFEETT